MPCWSIMKATKGQGIVAAGKPLPHLGSSLAARSKKSPRPTGPKVDKERLVQIPRMGCHQFDVRKNCAAIGQSDGMEKHPLRRLPFSVRVFASRLNTQIATSSQSREIAALKRAF